MDRKSHQLFDFYALCLLVNLLVNSILKIILHLHMLYSELEDQLGNIGLILVCLKYKNSNIKIKN